MMTRAERIERAMLAFQSATPDTSLEGLRLSHERAVKVVDFIDAQHASSPDVVAVDETDGARAVVKGKRSGSVRT